MLGDDGVVYDAAVFVEKDTEGRGIGGEGCEGRRCKPFEERSCSWPKEAKSNIKTSTR